jgi:hypothetical protein
MQPYRLGHCILRHLMKWFKHMTNANSDDKLVTIRTNFGMWGIGAYWTILEMVASQMKAHKPTPKATFNVVELSSFLGCKRNKLDSFLKHLQNDCEMKLTRNKNIIEIEIPKLLRIKDNYLNDLEETSKKLPSIEVEEDVEVEEDINTIRSESLEKSIIERWNTFASENGIPQVSKLTDRRRSAIAQRLKEKEFDLDLILKTAKESDFLMGKKTEWVMDFDFVFCSKNKYIKILEGGYCGNKTQSTGGSQEGYEEHMRKRGGK